MRTLLRFLRPYWLETLGVMVSLAVNLAGVLLVPTILAAMINVGISTRDFGYIASQGGTMLVAAVVSGAGAFACNWLCADLSSKVGRDIRNAVYDASLSFSGGDFEQFGTGSMITRTLGDVNVIQMAITMSIQMILPVPFAAVIGIVLATSIDPQMGLLLAAVIAIVLAIAVVTVMRATPIFQALQGFIDRMNVRLRETITGVRVIRAFGKEDAEQAGLEKSFADYAASAIRVNWLFATLDCSAFLLMNLTEVAVIWLGGNRVGAHAMEIASISACVEYAMLILFFIMMAQMGALTIPRAFVCLERCRQVIDHEPSIADAQEPAVRGRDCAGAGDRAADAAPAHADRCGGTAGSAIGSPVLHFSNASFRFTDADEDTLHHLNFYCRRGTTTAIIGPTGSGKSTIAKLALRLHDVSDGRVSICGADVRDLAQAELRDRISYVPQKAWLFSGTIAENLRYGNATASDEQLWHALDVAQSGFVRELPDRLGSRVAQGGTNFSGGQRQRLAIARALVKRADLYIFDDSFSALDFKTDAALRRALADEVSGAAVLIIAQRINTIVNADQIVVLKDGRIQGLGTHADLLRTCPVYRDIARSQLKAEEIERTLASAAHDAAADGFGNGPDGNDVPAGTPTDAPKGGA